MRTIRSLPVILLLVLSTIAHANEGMWLPLLLEKLNEKEMKSMGMKISAKDIYSINNGSLKDAIISLGGFCTGELISSKGLILTNHHCGLDAVQNHSTLENNYIRNGFWAKNNREELPNPGLFATFIIRIEDISQQILNGITPGMKEEERQSAVDKNINEYQARVKKEAYQNILIKPFFEANQYFLFITETYKDVRLVGAPPSAIGSFGQDTDNWMWPRHTGDFSMFRIYAGKDNKPADYSETNVPYVPKKSLTVSLDGITEGDFTMVFGFPGTTSEYLHSAAVEQIAEVNDPVKVNIRSKALGVIDSFMRRNEQVKIQYSAKYASMSNYWKKWKGEILGLSRTRAVEKKKAYEAEFQKRVNNNPQWKSVYGTLLTELNAAYEEMKPLTRARDYYVEIRSKIELDTIVAQINALRNAKNNAGKTEYSDGLMRLKANLANQYKEYSPLVDKKLFEVLMEVYINELDSKMISPLVLEKLKASHNDFKMLADEIYGGSILTSGSKILPALEKNPSEFLESIRTDKASILFSDIAITYKTLVAGRLNEIQGLINSLQRRYMKAQMEIMKERKFYPDANRTLRVTYGNVKGYNARDGVKYDYYTYLDGVMEKYIPGDYEFDVPQKLRELYQKKDYGQYGKNGKMPVCFIATNHTTGGNSGSPVLDAYGNLVGLNFDRAWEGVMSDISYDPAICRNIIVDIRYVLFIIDKFAGAGYLVGEMKLVHPKKN